MSKIKYRFVLIGIGLVLLVTYLYYQRTTKRRKVEDTRSELRRLYAIRTSQAQHAARKIQRRREELLDTMHRLATIGDPHQNLIELATLYKYGEYGIFQPNEDAAKMCARAALFTTTDPETKSRARVFLFTEDLEPVDVDDQSPELPYDYAKAAVRRTQTITATGRPVTRPRAHLRPKPVRTVTVHSDTQNAHDHGITTSTRDTLRGLEEVDTDATRPTILDFIATCDVSDDDKAKAIYALDSIRETVDSPYIGLSELDALSRVWHAVPDKTVVVQQLASAIEHGVPVCHSGKMARLAGCMDVVDPGARVPIWAIRQDVFGLAAAVRDEILASASTEAVQLYEAGQNQAMTEAMIAEFKRRVEQRTYTIDSAVLRSMVDDVSSGF